MRQKKDETTNDTNTTKNRPVHEVRLGPIRAAIWARQGMHGQLFHITASRLYRDRDDKWNSSTSFGREDLPLLVKVLDLAHSWTYEQSQTAKAEEAGEDYDAVNL